MSRGYFITLEGGEGAGKTTQLPFIADYLEQSGHLIKQTREPGGTLVSEAIRAVLLDTTLPAMDDETELLLMFAARSEHIKRTIQPALEQGKTVLCDRFTDASYAYQGGGRGLDVQRIKALEDWVQGLLRPDLTLIFDIDVALGFDRVRKRGAQDRIEQQGLDFFQRVRCSYLERARAYPERYAIIDAAVDKKQVEQQLVHVLNEHFSI